MYDNLEIADAVPCQPIIRDTSGYQSNILEKLAYACKDALPKPTSGQLSHDALPQFSISDSSTSLGEARLDHKLELRLILEIASGKISEPSITRLRELMKTPEGEERVSKILKETNEKLQESGSSKRLSLELRGDIKKDGYFQYYSETTNLVLKEGQKQLQQEAVKEHLHVIPRYFLSEKKYDTRNWLK